MPLFMEGKNYEGRREVGDISEKDVKPLKKAQSERPSRLDENVVELKKGERSRLDG